MSDERGLVTILKPGWVNSGLTATDEGFGIHRIVTHQALLLLWAAPVALSTFAQSSESAGSY
jgi:hypothetical protein